MRGGAGILFFLMFWAASAVRAEEMDQLRQDIQQNHAMLEELRVSREKIEKSAPLAVRAFELLKAGQYDETERALAEWEAVDPEDSRLPGLKRLVSKLKVEPDPARQADLWTEYLNKTLEDLQPEAKSNFVHRDR